MPDGRRIDLKAKREKRKTLKAKPKVAEPREDDRVAQTWDRTERLLRATVREQDVMQGIKGPRKAAEKQVRTRAQTGKESATPERMAMAGDDVEEDAAKVQRFSDWPLDALRKRKDGKGNRILTSEQYEAGKQYAEDREIAGLEKSPVSDPMRVSGGFGSRTPGFVISSRQAAAMDRVNEVHEKLPEGLLNAVQAVVLSPAGTSITQLARDFTGRTNENEARASFYDTVKMALNELARIYAPPPRTKMRASGERAAIDETQWQKTGSEG